MSANIYLFKVSNRNTRKKMWNMFKVNNKNIRTTSVTSFWCFFCWLLTYFTPFPSVSINDLEHFYCWVRCNVSFLSTYTIRQKSKSQRKEKYKRSKNKPNKREKTKNVIHDEGQFNKGCERWISIGNRIFSYT